jgi:hypothetical protein
LTSTQVIQNLQALLTLRIRLRLLECFQFLDTLLPLNLHPSHYLISGSVRLSLADRPFGFGFLLPLVYAQAQKLAPDADLRKPLTLSVHSLTASTRTCLMNKSQHNRRILY